MASEAIGVAVLFWWVVIDVVTQGRYRPRRRAPQTARSTT